jgi:hypothetical protein
MLSMEDLYSYSYHSFNSCTSINTSTTTSNEKWDDKICYKNLNNYIRSFSEYIGNNILMDFLGDPNLSTTLDYYKDKWSDDVIWKMSLGMYILSVFKYYGYDENTANCLLDFNNLGRFCDNKKIIK